MEAGAMAPAPIWTNVKTFPLRSIPEGTLDLVTGGYPCQPFSIAGRKKAEQDHRHLWPYIRDIIEHTRPTMCFFENVRHHIKLGLSTVLTELHSLGYSVRAGLFAAQEVGAPHRRERVFILAYSNSERLQRLCSSWKVSRREATDGYTRSCSELLQWPLGQGYSQNRGEEPRWRSGLNPDWVEQLMGVPVGTTLPSIQSDIREDRLRLCGNGVVPQQAEFALRYLLRTGKHE